MFYSTGTFISKTHYKELGYKENSVLKKSYIFYSLPYIWTSCMVTESLFFKELKFHVHKPFLFASFRLQTFLVCLSINFNQLVNEVDLHEYGIQCHFCLFVTLKNFLKIDFI